MLPDAVTARETGNASRTTMNEGIVGALRRNDTAAGIQADASPYVEKIKQLVPACAHACQLKMAYVGTASELHLILYQWSIGCAQCSVFLHAYAHYRRRNASLDRARTTEQMEKPIQPRR